MVFEIHTEYQKEFSGIFYAILDKKNMSPTAFRTTKYSLFIKLEQEQKNIPGTSNWIKSHKNILGNSNYIDNGKNIPDISN